MTERSDNEPGTSSFLLAFEFVYSYVASLGCNIIVRGTAAALGELMPYREEVSLKSLSRRTP
jgi:hypothetical protein